MQRKHNTYKFTEEVKKLVEDYGFEVSVEWEGESIGTICKLRIDNNAGVEVKITAGRCIITDKEGNSKQFENKHGSDEWKQESLDHIETLLKKAVAGA